MSKTVKAKIKLGSGSEPWLDEIIVDGNDITGAVVEGSVRLDFGTGKIPLLTLSVYCEAEIIGYELAVEIQKLSLLEKIEKEKTDAA